MLVLGLAPAHVCYATHSDLQTVLDSLGFLDDANKDKLLLGVTATPFRRWEGALNKRGACVSCHVIRAQ